MCNARDAPVSAHEKHSKQNKHCMSAAFVESSSLTSLPLSLLLFVVRVRVYDVMYAPSICSEVSRCAGCLRLHVCKCVRDVHVCVHLACVARLLVALGLSVCMCVSVRVRTSYLNMLVCDVTYAPSICSEASRCAGSLSVHVCKHVRACMCMCVCA